MRIVGDDRIASPARHAPDIDEFTQTTARGLEPLGAARGMAKAIIVLNPADPPILMRDTIYVRFRGGRLARRDHGVDSAHSAEMQQFRARLSSARGAAVDGDRSGYG